MALQAIGVDGLTTIWLWAEGTGTELDPYKSNFYAYQGGNWNVSVDNFPSFSGLTNAELRLSPLEVTGTFWQDVQPVTFTNTEISVDNFPSFSGLTNTELRADPVPVSNSLPTVTSGTILSLTTNATGTTYTAFPSQVCTALDIVNTTGTTIEYRRNSAGSAMQIPDKSARLVLGITNANQIDIRRTDTSNTQVTLQAEAFVL